MAQYLLAIDQGTTSTRAILFDLNGQVCGVEQKELKLFYPNNGWVEQNPHDIWHDTQHVCRSLLKQKTLSAKDIISIGITNQRETTILWDRKTGEPVYNAIVWQDRRTAAICEELKRQDHEDMVRRKTGLLLDPYFSATKIKWILDNVRGVRERAVRGDIAAGTIDSFLLWKMTGGAVHATDATNASRTMLFNISTQSWDDELLSMLGINRGLLPDVRDNCANFGHTTPDFLGAPITIGGMAGDQQAALIGQACFTPGMVKSTYGTGCFMLANIGTEFKLSENKMLTTIGYRLQGKTTYAIEGAIFVAGAAVQWLRDGLGIIKSASETEAIAKSVPDNGGVYMVPAFTGLGAPHWNPDARGLITGLTRASTSAHIVRAALEAQAYQTEDLMQAMAQDAGFAIQELRVDGGLVKNNWVCQFLADITRVPVVRPHITETTALGAAYLAGLQAGVFGSLDDISTRWQEQKRFMPVMVMAEREVVYKGWKSAIGSLTL